MSLRHHKAMAWEQTLKGVFDEIDQDLESQFGDRYPLHPARAELGKTANPEHDGLFSVGASFSAGFGSQQGAGYIVNLRVATLSHVPKDALEAMEIFVADKLREKLSVAFPERELHVTRDGSVFKIHGDLSLGNA